MQRWILRVVIEGAREEGVCLGGESEVVTAEARMTNSAIAATSA